MKPLNVTRALMLALCTAGTLWSQGVEAQDAARIGELTETLRQALTKRDFATVEPLLDASFHVASFTGPQARAILKQVVEAGAVNPDRIVVDSTARDGALTRVYTTFVTDGAHAARTLAVTDAGKFAQIGIMRIGPPPGDAASTQLAGMHSGVSLGAAPAGTAGMAGATVHEPQSQRELLALLANDTRYRGEIASMIRSGSARTDTARMNELTTKQAALDTANAEALARILDRHGWPSPHAVGVEASTAAFLVLQHAPAAMQEKYLDMARAAARRGELQRSALALLEDRILMRQGKKQLYGSQLHTNRVTGAQEVWPIEDEAHVDERRAAAGLGPLAEYLKTFGIAWPPKR